MTDATDAIAILLGKRSEDATICPSEVARYIAGSEGDWRAEMPAIHASVDRLVDQGRIRLSWKGEPMQKRNGPYRIGAPAK